MTSTIEMRQEALEQVYFGIFGKNEDNAGRAEVVRPYSEIDDDELIRRAMLSRNGDKFKALWDGSTLGYGGDDSAADMALMNYLAFWTHGNPGQMERLFSESGLGRRDKWTKRRDYRERTIREAIDKATEFYEPPADEEEISEEELDAYSLSEGPKFECKLPKNNFLQSFMEYGSDISDAYLEFWFAGGLFALAVIADKMLKVTLKQGEIYPNLYVFISGKSSLSRKSTAVDKTEAMIRSVMPSLLQSLVPTEFSPEAFIQHLSDYNHASWVRDEAAGVLSLMKKEYMRGFKDSLMLLYDCKPYHRQLRTSQRKDAKTEFRVDDPYLNVFFATTDASLGANTELNDTLSGFMARFLFFFPQGKKTKWLPLEEGTADISFFESVVRNHLTKIAEKVASLADCVNLHFSTEAAAYYREWQRVREEQWTASNDGDAMQIYSRLAPTVTKLAMLFELGSPDFDESRPIRVEFIEEACRLVDTYFMPTALAVYEIVGANADKNVIDRIIMYLKKHNGKATQRDILRDIKIKAKDFEEYLTTMVQSGLVEIKTVSKAGKGRDTKWILLLEQSRVGTVARVDKIAKVSKVECIPAKNCERDSTLATLAPLPTVATVAAEAKPAEELIKPAVSVGIPDKAPARMSSKELDEAKASIRKTIAQIESEGKDIIPWEVTKSLGLEKKNPLLVMYVLISDNYIKTEEVDSKGQNIWRAPA